MRRLPAALLLLVAAGCDGPLGPIEPSRSSGRIRPDEVSPEAIAQLRQPLAVAGRVLDFTTGAGIQGATVTFRRFGLDDVTAMTGADVSYALALTVLGQYEPFVDGVRMGGSLVHGLSYRGDFLVNPGHCVSRYGVLVDTHTRRPIAGATLELHGTRTTSEPDGWYRLDVECPAERPPGCSGGSTTFISILHRDYGSRVVTVGRGLCGASRRDIVLTRSR